MLELILAGITLAAFIFWLVRKDRIIQKEIAWLDESRGYSPANIRVVEAYWRVVALGLGISCACWALSLLIARGSA